MVEITANPMAAIARQPRSAVRLNGIQIAGCEAWEIENNAFSAADSFSIRFAAQLLPVGYAADWFGAQTSIDAEIFANAAPAAPDNYQPVSADRLILGQVDDISYDPGRAEVTLTGRDFTARLIDTKVSEGHLNQTSSQIAQTLAARHALTPVISATATQIGTFYSQNYISLTQQRSEWDLLTELAGFENFDAYIWGDELHFEPRPDPETAPRYALVWRAGDAARAAPAANITAIRFDRSLTLARGVSVTVKSWHARQGQRYLASYPKSDLGSAANPLAYNFIEAGLTQDQCQAMAQARYQEITQHTVRLSAELPGDGLLDCRQIVTVAGTGTPWDQDYFPDSVHRTMSSDSGYRMTISAKNINANIATTEPAP
jgi:phage protein D